MRRAWLYLARSAGTDAQEAMNAQEYVKDPCGASSLPFWKTEQLEIPAHISVIRDDRFSAATCSGTDEPYFKLVHTLEQLEHPPLTGPFEAVQCEVTDYARHIHECYVSEGISCEGLFACQKRPVYDPDLWIAVRDQANRRIVATGIADLDQRIGEGILEWIQVSPDYRRRGLGRYIVCELLRRMWGKARFVTVSGRLNNPCNPLKLYRSCGFVNLVIWHIVTGGTS